MDFAMDARSAELAERMRSFLDEYVYPAEPVLAAQSAAAEDRWAAPKIIAELQAAAREAGLWNLFLTGPHGAGLTNLQYAPLAELMGRSPLLAPVATNCAAPDTGNMELLAEFGTPDQKRRWLRPLLDAKIRSAFCMTEPGVSSSDATNVALKIDRCADGYRLTGPKWWASGALHPQCELLVVLGRTDPDGERHRQHSILLVPRNARGVRVRCALTVFGYSDEAAGGHALVDFDNVLVPADHLLGTQGAGFTMAQARLAGGRIHHCMRLIGMAERGLELMCRRLSVRTAFGSELADSDLQRSRVARARVAIDQVRLLVLNTAWLLDAHGPDGVKAEIHAVKIAAPQMATQVIDMAIQAHGAAGLDAALPLATLWSHARALRIADGPDEVHLRALGRRELASQLRRSKPESPADAAQRRSPRATTTYSRDGARHMHSQTTESAISVQLACWFARTLPNLGEPLTAAVLAGGRSNLTYRLDFPASTVVLRRPPAATLLHTAHDMHREYTVLSRVAGGAIPVPRPLAFCDDPDVIGAPFFVMEHIAGHVLRDTDAAAAMSPQANAQLSGELADTLANIHRIDRQAAGLDGFGRPKGFMQRQLLRWHKQWNTCLPALSDSGRIATAADRAVRRLKARLPRNGVTGLLHGDFRPDNAIIRADRTPMIAAILDWEMSTLGDPLADLGLTLVHWCLVEELRQAGMSLPAAPTAAPGFFTGEQFARRYAERTGFDLSHLDDYLAFGCFKLAAVLLGARARTVPEDRDAHGEMSAPVIASLIDKAHEILDEGRGPWFTSGANVPIHLARDEAGRRAPV
jgi:acyl-CoA dehydrogenase